jgi:hypothetical protein
VGQNHTKTVQNFISAISSNKVVKNALIFFKPWWIKKGGRECPSVFINASTRAP